MQTIERMISTSKAKPVLERKTAIECVEACFECAQACVACADACLAESNLDMLRRCIRLNLDCADICGTTARVLSRQLEADPQLLRAQVEACARACATCGAECDRHASHHEHCKVCAEVCKRCEEQCRKVLQRNGGARA